LFWYRCTCQNHIAYRTAVDNVVAGGISLDVKSDVNQNIYVGQVPTYCAAVPGPLTLCADIWHTRYFCPGESCSDQFWLFYTPFSFYSCPTKGQTGRQTGRRTRPVL